MSDYQDIDFQQAREILDREQDSVLLDVREEEELITGHPIEAELLPLSTLSPATPAELNELLQNGFPAADTTNCAGQIATGFSWKFYAVCDLATADRLDGISSVKISVPGKQNTPLSAAVQELTRDEDAGLAKLVVSCQTVNAEILSFGVETAQIDLKTYEGIRIDKAALHIVDGQRGVYVKYGNLQRFLKIETLYEQSILFRFCVILLAGLFGVLGLTCAALMILAMACGSEPFGYDYLYPLMPPGKASVRDGFVRSIWSELAKAGEVIGRHEM